MALAPNSLQARDVAYTVHPYTNLRQHERQGPLVITGGDGVYVTDDDGKRYIEGLAGLWCTGLGFSEKRLVEAARRQLDRLPYTHGFAHRSHGLVQRVFRTASFPVGHHDSFLLPLVSPSPVRSKHAEAVTLSGFLVLHRWTMGAATGAVADATAEGASLPHLTSYLLACAT